MNTKEIKELIDLLKGSDISEMEIEREGVKIKLKKGPSGAIITPSAIIPPQQILQMPQQVAPAPVQIEPAKVSPEKDSGMKIVSPMVGTFYRSPSPDSQPFVKEGDVIKEGQTVCIIEAMKLMNEIKAESNCKIVKVLAENGQPVEFGHPLFMIQPA